MIKSSFIHILDSLLVKPSENKVVFLSDDWGSLRIKSKFDQSCLVKKGLILNNRFDKYDSLETDTDIEFLFDLLLKYKDYKGNHPVFTAITNVANPDFQSIRNSNYQDYFFETIEQTYKRYPNSESVLRLFSEGVKQKIFIPQSHGREHLQVHWWMKELQFNNTFANQVFENEYFSIPSQHLVNSYRNRDLAAAFDVFYTDDIIKHNETIKSGLNIFNQLFDFKSMIFVPPAVYHNPKIEVTLYNQGVQWLDVSRVHRYPLIGGGDKLQFNFLNRKKKSGIKVLVRNSVFESNLSDSDNGVDRCLRDINKAFKLKQPAIISNHRCSFSSRIDEKNRDRGLKSLDTLLKSILEKWPNVEFVSAPDLLQSLS